jgi:hypothetical protein
MSIVAAGIAIVVFAALMYGFYYVLFGRPLVPAPEPGLSGDVYKDIVDVALFNARDALARTKERTSYDPIVSRHALTSLQRNVNVLSTMSSGYHAQTRNKDVAFKSRYVQAALYYKYQAYLDYALIRYLELNAQGSAAAQSVLELYETSQGDMQVLARTLFVERQDRTDVDLMNRLDKNTLELYQT